mmetsp:Transcript_2483/g.4046  ORF Transcript_2483/g.4046 Transcript_2483/m.4046 type:complete len:211 (-) Transcript_2483:991-1623(-)
MMVVMMSFLPEMRFKYIIWSFATFVQGINSTLAIGQRKDPFYRELGTGTICCVLESNCQAIQREEKSKHGNYKISKLISIRFSMQKPSSEPEHQSQPPKLEELPKSRSRAFDAIILQRMSVFFFKCFAVFCQFSFLHSQGSNGSDVQQTFHYNSSRRVFVFHSVVPLILARHIHLHFHLCTKGKEREYTKEYESERPHIVEPNHKPNHYA